MIKRRRDYEIYCRHRADWHQDWQIFGNVYSIHVIFHPEFIRCIWYDFKGMRWRALKSLLRRMVYCHGKARPEEEIWAEEMYCRKVFEEVRQYLLRELMAQ